MNKQLKYYFTYIYNCNMCDSERFNILGKRLNTSQGLNPKNKIGITTSIVQCKNCGLIFSNPQPIPCDIQDHYGITPQEYWKESYFKIDENCYEGLIYRLKSLVDVNAGMKTLDIGAGIGKAMMALSKAGFDSYGFEPSKPFYQMAIDKMGISPDKLKHNSIEEVLYPENTFDFISFGAVLEHLYDPADSIIKALNWLKPGGVIHIEVPSSNWLVGKIINLVYKLKGLDYVGNLSPMHSPFHLYEFSLKSFQKHGLQCGYTIAYSEYYVCETYMPKITDYLLKKYMKQTNTGMQLCVWIKKNQ